MTSIETLKTFLGWCTVFNGAFLLLSAAFVATAGPTIMGIHSKLFGVRVEDLPRAYFQFLAQYEIAVFVFNVAPYLALVLMN